MSLLYVSKTLAASADCEENRKKYFNRDSEHQIGFLKGTKAQSLQ